MSACSQKHYICQKEGTQRTFPPVGVDDDQHDGAFLYNYSPPYHPCPAGKVLWANPPPLLPPTEYCSSAHKYVLDMQ